MGAPSGAHADGWRMLHPLGLIVALVQSIRSIVSMFVSLTIVLRMALRDAPAWVACALIVAAASLTLAQPLIRWASTRYRLGPDSLQLRSGLFFRRHRTIGYGSIHAVDSSSPVYMRPFGIVQLTVSAAGAADTTVTLDAVPAALQLELERLRSQACAATATAPDDLATDAVAAAGPVADDAPLVGHAAGSSIVPAGALDAAGAVSSASGTSPASAAMPASNAPVFRASVRDIMLYAVTDLGFIAAAFVVFGFVQNLEDLLPREWVWSARRSVGDYAARGAVAVLLLVLICAIVLMVVSIITSLLRFYGFEVWRRGDDLVVVRGLFTRRTTTIPVSRIQTIVVRQSLLRRPFRLCSVGLGLSSAPSGDGEESGISAARILPVIGTSRVYGVLHTMLPEWDLPDMASTRGAMRAAGHMPFRFTGRGLLRYYVTLPLAVTVAACVGTVVAMGAVLPDSGAWPWWLMALPLTVGAAWTGYRWACARCEGYAILPDTTTGAPPARADEVASDESPRVLTHRILMTGVKGIGRYALVTRRARVQSVTRSTTMWREPYGVEGVRMPLFVLNGIAELRWRFMHREDADTLEEWVSGRGER